MATKEKAKAAPSKKEEKAAANQDIVLVKDLAEEFDMPATKVRQLIRGLGFKAPAVDNEGKFGPRSKYGWPKDNADLAKIREALQQAVENGAGNEETEEE